jgi:hypothetical protein
VFNFYKVKAHLLLPGLTALVKYLYSLPTFNANQERRLPELTVLEHIDNMLLAKNIRYECGHYIITSETTSSGLAYRVRLPAFMYGKRSSTMFYASQSSPSGALTQAVQHRENTIRQWLRSHSIMT